MIRRILTFLTLTSFLVASQMHLVHASSMTSMPGASVEEDMMSRSDHSIFCEHDVKSGQKAPECIKSMDQDILPILKSAQDPDLSVGSISSATFLLFNPETFLQILSIDRPPPSLSTPPESVGGYADLVGIIKNLN